MARPERNNVDYFPFFCKEGKGMFYIETKYKNNGFATWIKILRELGKADYHYLNLSEEIQMMYLSAKCNIEIDVLINIINDLVALGEFDKELWNNNKIIFSQKFIDSISDAYKRRSNECVTRNSLIIHLDSLGIHKLPKCNTETRYSNKNYDNNPQSKVEKSKVEKSKVEKSYDYKKVILSEIKISELSDENKYYFDICMGFYNLFIMNLEKYGSQTNKIKKSKGIWIDDIRLLMTVDKYSHEDLQNVFLFLRDEIPDNNGFAWNKNIRSTSKLREKFDDLIIKANGEKNKQPNANQRQTAEKGQNIAGIINKKFGKKTG